MTLVRLRPMRADREIANAVVTYAGPRTEQAAKVLTWGADEKILLGLAVSSWLYVAAKKPGMRPLADHFLITLAIATVLPHLLKRVVNQTRPDRLTVSGHWRGIPLSGRSRDAFPSGHALHMGALASAAGLLDKRPREILRAIAYGLSLTRILLLAHWASDVGAGFAIGACLERLLRRFTPARPRGTVSKDCQVRS